MKRPLTMLMTSSNEAFSNACTRFAQDKDTELILAPRDGRVVLYDEAKIADLNIVMKDFIADDVAECEVSSKEAIHTIISLNVDKGNVKADKLEDFKNACGYNG